MTTFIFLPLRAWPSRAFSFNPFPPWQNSVSHNYRSCVKDTIKKQSYPDQGELQLPRFFGRLAVQTSLKKTNNRVRCWLKFNGELKIHFASREYVISDMSKKRNERQKLLKNPDKPNANTSYEDHTQEVPSIDLRVQNLFDTPKWSIGEIARSSWGQSYCMKLL